MEGKQLQLHKAYTDVLCQEQGDGLIVTKGLSNYDLRVDIAKEAGYTSFKDAYIDIRKALSTTLSTYSAGTLPVLIPVYVDPEIVDLTRRATPLVELIPRVTNYGKTADYNQITAIATAQPLTEDAPLSEQNDSLTRMSVSMKYLYSIGRVTGPMFSASKQYLSSGGYVDALSYEVKNKTLALKRLEEAMLLLGNSVAGFTEPVNSTVIAANVGFDGLWAIISDISSIGLGGSANYYTNISASASTPISIGAIRTAIRTCRTAGGEPNLIVTDYSTYDAIKALIQDQLRYVSQTNIAWGITTVSFEGIPIIASRFLSTTTGTSATTPATGKSLFVLDTNVIEMRVLQDVSYEELAKVNDSVKFMLKCYEALVVKAPQFNNIITGIY